MHRRTTFHLILLYSNQSTFRTVLEGFSTHFASLPMLIVMFPFIYLFMISNWSKIYFGSQDILLYSGGHQLNSLIIHSYW